ncbi:MAG TPA: LLM class flavin-dependent oxidoreductase [Candidatus Sulfotelmatobacter sp.]|nr:LLM class flavin-dependent oxidoreductase [Candidatus Sulfotelmatobacter sp.]
MKFSICLPTGFEGLMHPIPFAEPEVFLRLARLCESLGYDSVWGNDHITTQHYVRALYPGQVPRYYEPIIVMAHVAAATSRLRLGTAVTVLPMHEPVYLAKQVATLDQLSGGRFMLGVGVGAYREEFLAWNGKLAHARRGDMMDEGLAALARLFVEPRCSFTGEYYAFSDIELAPKPRQTPFPLYVGGHNLPAVERAARHGQGWLPGWRPLGEMQERIRLLKERTAALGRDADAVEVAPQMSVTLGKTQEAAEQRYMQSGLVAHRKSLAYTGRDLGQQTVANLVGSPDVVLQKIDRLAAIGIDHCCALMFPADSVSEAVEQIEWFGKLVQPLH